MGMKVILVGPVLCGVALVASLAGCLKPDYEYEADSWHLLWFSHGHKYLREERLPQTNLSTEGIPLGHGYNSARLVPLEANATFTIEISGIFKGCLVILNDAEIWRDPLWIDGEPRRYVEEFEFPAGSNEVFVAFTGPDSGNPDMASGSFHFRVLSNETLW